MSKKILIVDDSEFDREIMKRFLTKAGYDNLVLAETGEEGLQKARTEQPDLIVLDVMLPKLDGFKICRMLKFDEKYKDIPILMCTSLAREADEATGFEVGANDYITKNFDPPDLIAKVKKLLGE
ncbi:response regulator transcription factor [Candidatus Omnitrophota bacterium]